MAVLWQQWQEGPSNKRLWPSAPAVDLEKVDFFSSLEIFQACVQKKAITHFPQSLISTQLLLKTTESPLKQCPPSLPQNEIQSLQNHLLQIFLSLELFSVPVGCVRKQDFKRLETCIFIPKSLIGFCLPVSLWGERVSEENQCGLKVSTGRTGKGEGGFHFKWHGRDNRRETKKLSVFHLFAEEGFWMFPEVYRSPPSVHI